MNAWNRDSIKRGARRADPDSVLSVNKRAELPDPEASGSAGGVGWHGAAQGWETPASDRASYAASIYVKRVTMATTMLLQTERIMYVMVVHHVSRGSTGSVSN